MTLRGKRIAILVEDLYQELEVWYPYYRLKEEGADVELLGTDRTKSFTGKFGYPANADRTIGGVSAEEYDAVVIPGGFAPDYLRRSVAMVQLVKDMSAQGKVIAAICHGAWMLASAEIVHGKHVTCFSAIRDDLRHAGAHYSDEEVIRDGNLITSRKPEDLPAFCRTIIGALSR